MDLSQFTDMQFGDEESFREFLDANAIAHETIFTALLSQGVVISHLPLFTFGNNDRDWLLIHATEHRAISAQLGLPTPPSLEDVNFENQDQFYAWLSDHDGHHHLIDLALGL